MEQGNKGPDDEAAVDRVEAYRERTLLGGVAARLRSAELCFAHHADGRGNAALALGALRVGLGTVLGLAAEPARTRDEVIAKVDFLDHAADWLDAAVAGAERLDVPRMLAVAATVEGSHWNLPRRHRTCPPPPMTSGLKNRWSPTLDRRFRRAAGPHDLDVALRGIALVDADFDRLSNGGGGPAVAGALHALVEAVLLAVATPGSSPGDLARISHVEKAGWQQDEVAGAQARLCVTASAIWIMAAGGLRLCNPPLRYCGRLSGCRSHQGAMDLGEEMLIGMA